MKESSPPGAEPGLDYRTLRSLPFLRHSLLISEPKMACTSEAAVEIAHLSVLIPDLNSGEQEAGLLGGGKCRATSWVALMD